MGQKTVVKLMQYSANPNSPEYSKFAAENPTPQSPVRPRDAAGQTVDVQL